MSKGIRADLITTEMRVTQFWRNVQVGRPDECWPWMGYTERGYGWFFDGRRMVGAHELALTYSTGERRSPGLDTCHSCDSPPCCNPAHLRFDTRQSNVDDAIERGRHARGERNGQAILTEIEVLTIRVRHANGATGRALAAQYGVGEAAINAILTGRNWRHVGGPIRATHGKTKHGRWAKSA